MELQGISQLDLNGILFIHFPDDTPMDECRDRLELLIYEAWEQDYEGVPEDERLPMCISPYWVFRALKKRDEKVFSKMSSEEKEEWKKYSLELRDTHRKEAVVGLTNPQNI